MRRLKVKASWGGKNQTLRRKNKYRAVKVTVEGIEFDSGIEARRYQELRLMEAAGEIKTLQRQVPFELKVNGVLIAKIIADFWFFEGARSVIEEVKSEPTKTRAYRIKRKLFMALYPGIEHREYPPRKKLTRRRLTRRKPTSS